MKKAFATLATILILGGMAFAQEAKIKSIYKVFRLNPNEVGISCLNGADPTGRKDGGLVNHLLR